MLGERINSSSSKRTSIFSLLPNSNLKVVDEQNCGGVFVPKLFTATPFGTTRSCNVKFPLVEAIIFLKSWENSSGNFVPQTILIKIFLKRQNTVEESSLPISKFLSWTRGNCEVNSRTVQTPRLQGLKIFGYPQAPRLLNECHTTQ